MNIIVSQTEIDAQADKLAFGGIQALNEIGQPDGNGNRIFELTKLTRIMQLYQLKPGQKAAMPAEVLPTNNPFVGIRKRTAEEIESLQKICSACDKFDGKNCLAAKCCGGKLPIATTLGININHCPLGKF